MISLPCKKINLSVHFYILYFSIYLVFAYALPTVLMKLQINTRDMDVFASLMLILSELILVLLFVVIFLLVFSFSRVLLKAIAFLFCIISAIFSYYIYSNKIIIDEFLLASIVETPLADAGNAIGYQVFLWTIFAGVLPGVFWTFIVKINYHGNTFIQKVVHFIKSFIKFSICFVVLLFVSYILNIKLYKDPYGRMFKIPLVSHMPTNYVIALYQYVFQLNKKKIKSDKINITKIFPFTFYDNDFYQQDYTVILVVGESSRAANQSMNGYKRNTNPNLSKVDNLINFSRVYSCGTITVYSLHCLLSYMNKIDFTISTKESNIISVFKSLNFTTHYISTQPLYNDLALMYFAVEDADSINFATQIRNKLPSDQNLYDEYLLDFVEEAEKKAGKKFIVMQLMTSHTPYETRYPKDFNIFKSDNQLVDSYDNSILYTDYVMAKLIAMFKDKKAFIYFVSDHGESLGEGGYYLHGASPEIAPIEQVHVFQFLWASDLMIKMMKGRYNNIRAKKDDRLSHDNVFSSLLDCMGVKSEIVIKKLSLCK